MKTLLIVSAISLAAAIGWNAERIYTVSSEQLVNEWSTAVAYFDGELDDGVFRCLDAAMDDRPYLSVCKPLIRAYVARHGREEAGRRLLAHVGSKVLGDFASHLAEISKGR